jgi:choline dehydrogenase
MSSPVDRPLNHGADPVFDYVIVGAGSAGCVLAARLSEDPGCRVLLVEAGPEDRPPHTFDPVLWPTEVGGAADWRYTTVPQPGLGGRTSAEPHGRMVGGSSSLNGMMWTRGDPSDFDAWAHGGAPGWGYDALAPYFRRVEDCVDDPDPELGHGGPVYLQHRGFRTPHPAARAFVEAAVALGFRRDETFDGRAGMLGAGYFATNVKDGRRFGAREAYLLPALGRPNLTVWPDTRALGLAVEDGAGGRDPRCAGVEVLREGQRHTVRAAREVLLCASAAEGPKLLMLAGVGPEEHLRSLGIPVRVALPGVGANLHDHVMCVLRFRPARPLPEAEFAWEAGAFYQSDPGWVGPDLETIFNPTAFDKQVPGAPPMGITMVTTFLRPMARGTVGLASTDPHAAPVLDPQFLSVPADAARLATAVRTTLRLAATPPLDGWVAGLTDGNGGLDPAMDDAALVAWVRANALSQYHMAGTCKMGLGADAVVDPHLRVHGVAGLRVVDVSVLPRVVSGHCQAAVLAIAERAADLLAGAAPPATTPAAALAVPAPEAAYA